MNGVERRRHVLAYGLAALIHAGLALVPLPRAADDPARPEIEPGAISVEVVARTPPSGDSAPDTSQPPVQPHARAGRGRDPAAQTAVRTVRQATGQTTAYQPARSNVRARPAGLEASVHRPQPGGLQPRDLDLGDSAVAPAVDGLPDHLAGHLADHLADHLSGSLAGELATGEPAAPLAPAPRDGHAYALRVRARVEAEKRYPARARRQGQEGEATVGLRIAPDGRLLGRPRVVASSGARALDREAVRMARAAAPFPPSGAATAIEIAVPVRFSLDER